MASLQFHGAARQVTGSRHLLTANDSRVLFECGMVQGRRELSNRLNRDLGLDPTTVDAVVLSHAHIDHSGSLPRLVKLGFRGKIHCTAATADLIELLLHDSAGLQAQDAAHLRKRGHDFEPPYDGKDVEQTMKQVHRHDYHETFDVVDGVTVQFFDAGHILGSAQEFITVHEGNRRIRIGFTGDHGRKQTSILRDPDRLPEVDVLITESTYGNRLHEETPRINARLAEIVQEEMRDGGRILVPAFAIGRTQNLLLSLSQLIVHGRIPAQPIFIDSPMATQATRITRRYPELYDAETHRLLDAGRDPFFFEGVRFVADVQESISLNDVRSGIIISASGMCEGGRILHHLKRSIVRPEDCVLAVGFMAEGTLGRKLVDGQESVNIYGDSYPVRCKVRSLLGLSAHADYQELIANLAHLAPAAQKVFVVHGEEQAALAFVDRLTAAGFRDVQAPEAGTTHEL